MPVLTPAEKSSKTIHLLSGEKSTWCGIQFRRQKFYSNKTTTSAELSDCKKCTDKFAERADAKAKKEKKPAVRKKK